MKFKALTIPCTMLTFLLFNHYALGKEYNIGQKNKTYSMENKKIEELKIKVGDKINFINDDKTSHNVFSSSKVDKFNLKIQKPNSSNSHTFKNEGTVTVRCAIHPKMKINIVVEK